MRLGSSPAQGSSAVIFANVQADLPYFYDSYSGNEVAAVSCLTLRLGLIDKLYCASPQPFSYLLISAEQYNH